MKGPTRYGETQHPSAELLAHGSAFMVCVGVQTKNRRARKEIRG